MLMWLIEHWLLNLPGEFWILLAGLGFIAFFFASIFSHIPFLRPYMMFVKPVGGLIVLGSVFMYGGTELNNIWEERVKQAQEQVAAKELEAEEINKKLAAERKKKQEVRLEYRTTVKTEIQTSKEYIDKECKFESEINKLHNKAARNILDTNPVEKND